MSTEIQVFDNGPVFIKGEITLKDGAGDAYNLEGKENVALCRCGASANKPFCDGAHKSCGFESQVKAG